MPKVVDAYERRAELAAAVWSLASREGVEAVTTRQLATEAGCSTGAIVHYFPDKEALLVFAFELVAARAAERMGSHSGAPALERAQAVLAEGLPLDDERRTEVRLWFGLLGLALTRPQLAEAQREGYRRWRQLLAGALREAGVVSEAEADAEAGALIATVDGLAVQAFFDPRAWPVRRLKKALADRLAAL